MVEPQVGFNKLEYIKINVTFRSAAVEWLSNLNDTMLAWMLGDTIFECVHKYLLPQTWKVCYLQRWIELLLAVGSIVQVGWTLVYGAELTLLPVLALWKQSMSVGGPWSSEAVA